MERLKSVWRQFRRDERWTLVVCAVLLACFAAYGVAKRQSTPPLPPLFVDAPAAAVANAATGNMVSAPADGTVMVQVAGEVYKPGVIELPANARVVDAVRKAGGPTKAGDANALNLAARVQDGEKIVVAKRGVTAPAAMVAPRPAAGAVPPTSAATSAGAKKTAGRAPQLSGPVNVNTADAGQLDLLPGVGPKTAALIIAYRQAHGAFRSLQDLDRVKGLGPKKLEKIAPHVVF
jgi:competence protein ComEA